MMHLLQDLDKGILGKPDPIELWEEIISHIPDETLVYNNQKFLFPTVGQGTEVKVMIKRLVSLNWTRQQIIEAFYICDKYNTFTNDWIYKRGFKNVHTGDFLEWDLKDMKFDVVLGNPPYTQGIWQKFFNKFTYMSKGVVASINPDPSLNDTSKGENFREALTEAGIQVRKECTEHFDVKAGTISYFICDKSKEADTSIFTPNTIDYKIKDKVVSTNINPPLFLRCLVIVKDCITSNTKETETPYPLITGMSKDQGMNIVYTNKLHRSFTKVTESKLAGRVFIMNQFLGKNSDTPIVEILDTSKYVFGNNNIVFKPGDSDTIAGFKSLYESKLYKFVLGMVRGDNFGNRDTHLKVLPKLDLSKIWTDKELYKHFKLTQEEIDYIEDTIKN